MLSYKTKHWAVARYDLKLGVKLKRSFVSDRFSVANRTVSDRTLRFGGYLSRVQIVCPHGGILF